ncbi:MAG: SAM-dependent methyltransferase [Oscillospiraceae bacterium]|nr:SAM-dependent methyltransferase [Oscillospiraceae bacterium]
MADLNRELAAALPLLQKAVFSQPTEGAEYQKVTLRPVTIKGKDYFQMEGFRDNKAFHRNLSREETLALADESLAGRYRQVLLMSGDGAAQYVLRRDGSYKKSGKSAVPRPGGEAAYTHDREKRYLLAEGENIPALVDLGVFTPDLRIVKAKYDKYRQINRFVELIDDAFSSVEPGKLTVLDFGCGKSYLTFILYYYFAVKRGFDVEMIGYDLKEDVVGHCNAVAEKYGYSTLHFETADVSKDKLLDKPIDLLVTLHACDTATDYALDFAVRHGAKYIFSVPCCQHEINASISKGGDLDALLRYGVVKERVSALLTDSIRAGILEDMGYTVDLMEFVDLAHSPKNLMIRAEKRGAPREKNIPRFRELAERYGFRQTLLELCDRKEQ